MKHGQQCRRPAALGVMVAVLALSCGSRRPPEVSSLSPHETDAAPRSAHATLDGRRVHYRDAGPRGAPPLVLVHGWACDSRTWGGQVETLARRWRVLAVDLPGHGESEEPAGTYDMDLFARGIKAVLDHAGVKSPAILVGHSNGVPAVRQFHRRHRSDTRALVLVDGPLKLMVAPEVAERFLAAFSGDGWREAVAGFVDSMPTPGLSPEHVATIREMATSQSKGAVAGGLRAGLDPDVYEADPIDVPVLVLNAEQPAWNAEYEAHVRSLAPDLDYRTWTGVSHFLMMDRPDEFNALLSDFARRVTGS